MKSGQRTHHDGHRHPEADSENPRRLKRTMSIEETRSSHEEGKAEFNNARSGSTRNRRRCGITREVIGRYESVKRTLNPPPSRLLPPDPPSSSASNSGTAHTLPPLRPASPLTLVDYDDDVSARTALLRRQQNQGQKARNYGTNDDAMRRISYGETAITPPIPSPHEKEGRYLRDQWRCHEKIIIRRNGCYSTYFPCSSGQRGKEGGYLTP